MPALVRTVCLAAALAALACSRPDGEDPAPNHAAIQTGFDSAATRLLVALRADRVDSVLALMAEDVTLMPPNEPVLKGKGAVRTWYQGLVSQLRTVSLTVQDREVRIGGEWVTEVASFEWTLAPVASGAEMTERGTYVQVWQREPDGRFLLTREVWNSSTPPVSP
jgi:ketosteroid isomerase-like protein